MWSGTDYIWTFSWLVIIAARYTYRFYCQRLEWIPFFTLFLFPFVIRKKRMLYSFISKPKAMNSDKEKREWAIIIRVTSNHHRTSVQMPFVHSSIEQLLTHMFVFKKHARSLPFLHPYILPPLVWFFFSTVISR